MPLHRVGPLPHRLGVRLIAAVGLSLLPLAILAYVQSSRLATEAQGRLEAALFGETLMAALPMLERMNSARGMAAVLATSVLDAGDDNDACMAMLLKARATEPSISFLAYVRQDGRATCTSDGKARDFADNPVVQDLLQLRQPQLATNHAARLGDDSDLVIMHPVLAADGSYQGFISISIPHRQLDPQTGITARDNGGKLMSLITFDNQGEILSSRFGLDTAAQRLPTGRPLVTLAGEAALTFSGATVEGEQRTFAVVPIAGGQLFLLSSWPPVVGQSYVGVDLPLWLFPAAMWVASLLVAWLATEFQVLRYIRALRRSIIAFSGGNRAVLPPDLHDAPLELRHVGESYERLVRSVLHDEAALENMVHQKEVLLREVHHRVKNNLQLIASIMNIQMRKAASPEAKALIKGMHDRVMSLATVHRELYQTSGQADVRADELLPTILAQVLRMGAQPGREIALQTDIERLRLTPDQSVPLSLIMTEALTNVLKHARPEASDRKVHLTVSFRDAGGGMAQLLIRNSASRVETAPVAGTESTGLGAQLLQAFASQLGGEVTSGRKEDGFEVLLSFPLRSLAEAEERFNEDP
ncbi:MAG: histidine kinase dimerization/phosphoacceptor domain -containing protein [Paracoccaceae bacterium]